MIVVIDYDTGNTRNVKKALDYLNLENELTADPKKILAADGLILPGVGAFQKAMDSLNERKLVPIIQAAAERGIPILGICLGMQLLFDKSLEFGETNGLGIIPGEVVPIPENLASKCLTWGGIKTELFKPIRWRRSLMINLLTSFTHIMSRLIRPK